MNRTIFSRIMVGVKKGWNTPSLPQHLIELNNKPLIRIMRVLGGISFIMILSESYHNLYILIINIIFVVLFTTYHFYLSYLLDQMLLYQF